MRKTLCYKVTDNNTAVLYYVGRKRYEKLKPLTYFPDIEGFNIIIDKSCNSAIIKYIEFFEKYDLKIVKGSIKIYDLDLKSKKEEYECDGIIHTFSNSWMVRGLNRSNKYRPIYKTNKKDQKGTGLSEPSELAEFYINTICQFKACKMPKRIPDYISYSSNGEISSMYWYGTDSKGSYVIRYSNHWSKISKNIKSGDAELFQCQTVGTCWWTLIGNTATKCGKAYSNDFKSRRP